MYGGSRARQQLGRLPAAALEQPIETQRILALKDGQADERHVGEAGTRPPQQGVV